MSALRYTILPVLLIAALAGGAGEPLKPGRLTKAEQAALRPGLTLHLDHAGTTDTRRVRLAALHVPAGSPPSPFLEPGPFTAKFTGYLRTSLKAEFSFRLVARGSAVLRLNGKEILSAADGTQNTPAPVQLAKGYNRLELAFTSPTQGEATLRVYWSGEGFTTEPLPPDALFSRGDEPDLVRGEARREGRLLFATRGCAHCHELPGNLKEAQVAMPELHQRPPSLAGTGQRLEPAWVAQWILAPRALRPQARMPHVLHGAQAPQQAADLAAYLATQGGAALPAPAADAPLVADGEKLFDRLGCVACHHLDEPKQDDTLGRLSLHFVKAKFRPGALVAFLKAPHQHYPWIRMPDFKLDAKEAAALAAFLRDRAKGTLPPASAGDATRGAKLFTEARCASCHAVSATAAAPMRLPSPRADRLDQGCLAARPGLTPDFGCNEAQRGAIQAFLKNAGDSLKRETAAEFSLRQVRELQCQACHRRDGQTSRWNQILEDEGLMAEFLPSLTWAGEKLKPAWSATLFAGKDGTRSRPWLKARMPAFPARAEMLAAGLSHEHGLAPAEDDAPAPNAKLAAVGKKLIEQQGGFNCVMCHAVGARKAVAPFEAPGINLVAAAQRLRHHYYPRWMIDPPHVDITTRMPRFSQDGKTTPIRDVFSGDAFRQYDAVWHFIQTLPRP